MPKITNVRCVLLSSSYADADDPEIKECFPNGPKRTIGWWRSLWTTALLA